MHRLDDGWTDPGTATLRAGRGAGSRQDPDASRTSADRCIQDARRDVYGEMSTESPHPRVARADGSDLVRNERMIDAVQGLSRQLAETERTLREFISTLSASIDPVPAAAPPVADARRDASRTPAPPTPVTEQPPAGLAGHVLPTAQEQSDHRTG